MKLATLSPAAIANNSRKHRKDRTKQREPRRMQVQQLESRQLMAIDLAPASLLSPEVFEVEAAVPTQVAQTEMIETTVHGSLSNSADVDFFRVELNQGDIFTVDLLQQQAGDSPFALTFTDAQGQAVDANSIDPQTGLASDEAFIFRADRDGDFLVGIDSDLLQTTALDYDLAMRTVALHDGYIDPELLDPAVEELAAKDELKMYTWLDGDKLAVSGPTGHGFEIEGEWQVEQTNRLGNLLNKLSVRSETAETALNAIVTAVDQEAKSVEELTEQFANDPVIGFLHNGAEDLRELIDQIVNGEDNTRYTTYTTSGGDLLASGLLSVMGPVGAVDAVGDIVSGLLDSVKVEVNVISTEWDHSYGEIDSINLMLDLGDVELATGEGIDFDAAVNDLLAVIPGLDDVVDLRAPIASWGVKLGAEEGMQDLAGRFGAPLNSAVPYIHFAAHWALGASVGPVSVDAASAGFGVFVDPADPFVYIGLDNPVGPGGAKAISANGYIPLHLADHEKPDGWNESFFGHMYVKADGALTKLVQGEGEVTLDFDADDNGDVKLSDNVVKAFITGSPFDMVMVGAEAALNLDALPNPVELLAQSAVAVQGKFDIDILGLIKGNKKQDEDAEQAENEDGTVRQDDDAESSTWKGADPANDAKLSQGEMATREASAIDTKNEYQQKMNDRDAELANDMTADELDLWKAKKRDLERGYDEAEAEQDYWYQLRHKDDEPAEGEKAGTENLEDENEKEPKEDTDSDAIGSNMELIGTYISHPKGIYYHGRSALAVKEILGVEIADSGLASGALVTDIQVLADGSFRVRHAGEINLLGYKLSDAELIVTNEGATVEGFLKIPGPEGNIVEVNVSGAIKDGKFFLCGDGQVNLGVASSEARIYLDNSGVSASMEVDLAGSMVRVEGEINLDGTYSFQGATDINLLGMDMAGALVRIDSQSGVTIIAENTAGDSLKNQAAPALRRMADDARMAMDAAEADVKQARAGLKTLESRLAAARSNAASQVAALTRELDKAQAVVDKALSYRSSMKAWVDREYSAYRSAVRSRQSASWWNYASRRANEIYRYGRYQTARGAYNVANTALSVASVALKAIRNDAGWKALGVDANPQVIALTAELALARAAVDVAEASLAALNDTGIGQAFEDISGAALDAAAWLAENNGSDLLNLNRIEFRGSIDDLFDAKPGAALSLSMKVDYTFMGEREVWGVAMNTDDLLNDLGNALVGKLA